MQLRTILRLFTAGLALALLACGGYTYAATQRAAPKGGTNILLVGHDSRADLPKGAKKRWNVGGQACNCTDVMMLVHLSEDWTRASVVSLPRDSFVPFAPHSHGGGMVRHSGKINAAYQHGGDSTAVRTVEEATGLKVHHYISNNFKSFVRSVDSLGGAKVCTKEPMHDRNAGLDLSPGTHQLSGADALRYVRSRYTDGIGDIGRVRRQQRLIADIAGRQIAEGVLQDKVSADKLVRGLFKYMRHNSGTSTADLVRIAFALRDLKLSDVEFATVPVSSIGSYQPGWGSTVAWDHGRAERLFTRLSEDKPMKPADKRSLGRRADYTGQTASGESLLCKS